MSEKFNKTEANRSRNGWGDFDTMIETWDSGLDGREWIVCDRFKAADVMLGSSAIFLRMFGTCGIPERHPQRVRVDRHGADAASS